MPLNIKIKMWVMLININILEFGQHGIIPMQEKSEEKWSRSDSLK